MYILKNYLTDETVAIVSRKEDAIAMIQTRPSSKEPILIIEEV